MVPAIRTERLVKQFGTRRAVDRVSFELPQGSFLSVFGPNGAGKTTLLRLLATLSRPTEGGAELLGVDVKEEPEEARGLVGLISHSSMLYPDLTAEENLLFYARLYGVSDPEKRVLELLDAVGLKHRRIDRVGTFSRGMKQRVAIARALVKRSGLFIFDDSFSALDFKTDAAVRTNLARVTKGATVLIVAQRVAAAMDADQVIVVNEGRIEAVGTHEELLDTCQVYNDIVASQIDEEEAR